MFGFGKFEEKCKGKKIERKERVKQNKNSVKKVKLFLFTTSSSFYLF